MPLSVDVSEVGYCIVVCWGRSELISRSYKLTKDQFLKIAMHLLSLQSRLKPALLWLLITRAILVLQRVGKSSRSHFEC
jgi:hypothetical protein